ncbi:hypothetical protein G4228_015655 [Cervus hanglu yarkandensis]|nr:hypothetical protein G4228_015655 [Cervus hanglu yarkandensis]
MNRLCLSAALLFLLVILVDSTPVYEHHTQDKDWREMRRVLGRGWVGAANTLRMFPATWVRLLFVFGCHVMISGKQLEKRSVKELPTPVLQEENKAASRPAFCLEHKFSGPCITPKIRYFYNAKTGHCEHFIYGGCNGKKNNFLTEEECIKTCIQGSGSLW